MAEYVPRDLKGKYTSQASNLRSLLPSIYTYIYREEYIFSTNNAPKVWKYEKTCAKKNILLNYFFMIFYYNIMNQVWKTSYKSWSTYKNIIHYSQHIATFTKYDISHLDCLSKSYRKTHLGKTRRDLPYKIYNKHLSYL